MPHQGSAVCAAEELIGDTRGGLTCRIRGDNSGAVKRPSARGRAKSSTSTTKRARAGSKGTTSRKPAGRQEPAARPRTARAAPGSSRKRPPRLSARDNAARVAAIVAGLEALYPNAVCELDFQTPFQLLVATILSAQSTDKLVNQVTPALFARFPDAAAMAAADVEEVMLLCHSTGFFRQKSKNVVATAQQLMIEHGGEVPRTMEALTRLPGVARKTANVVLGSAYGMNEGIAVDTHVTRLSQRLGLSRNTQPEKIEQDLMKLLPRPAWTHIGHQIIWHGRRVCDAKRPACDRCTLAPHCPSAETAA